MYVKLNGEDVQEISKGLKNIFGIQSFSPAIKVKRDIEPNESGCLELVKRLYEEGKPLKYSQKSR